MRHRPSPIGAGIPAVIFRIGILGRSGTFWFREYHDRYIRNAEHFANAIRYIEENPVAAGLVKLAKDRPFGSARLK